MRWEKFYRHRQTAQGESGEPMGFAIEEERQQRAGLFCGMEVPHPRGSRIDQAKDPEGNHGKNVVWLFERQAEDSANPNIPSRVSRIFLCFPLGGETQKEPAPIQETRSLGWMLYDMDYQGPANPMPRFFNAEMKQGRGEKCPLGIAGR